MDELIPGERASRDFRVKFPDDVIQDNLAGQLWFGAEVIILLNYYDLGNNSSKTNFKNPIIKNVITQTFIFV